MLYKNISKANPLDYKIYEYKYYKKPIGYKTLEMYRFQHTKENNANDRNRRTGNRTENITNDQRKRKIRKQEIKYMNPFLITERT